MATSLHTLVDIFHTDFNYAEKPVPLSKVVIPIIQRDYAQGRKSAEISRVRSRFLEALYNAITEAPITLDFVYGDIDEKGVMTPLDGQQRLTTLFLLHWYAVKKENIPYEEYSFLENFSYEIRYSARDFCEYILKYQPRFDEKLSDEIIDQSWFPLDWMKDPTINAMLVMIDAISEKFADVENIWEKLCGNAITFYFLPIKDMGLTDELYIKMNSRGKSLTMFEHFKAELERELTKVDKEKAKKLISKIDLDWTDMLWQYRGDNNITDDEFLRYFRFICDIICYKSGGTMQGREVDEFDLLEEFFSVETKNVLENIELLEAYYDCWCGVNKDGGIDEFFSDHVSKDVHQTGKILADNSTNYFEDAIRVYGITQSNGNRLFSLGETVLLYAFVTYLLNRDKVTDDEFRRRVRVIRNLVDNSEDEISDSEARAGGNRMPAILSQVDSLIIEGKFRDDIEINFNDAQIAEEKEKLAWTQTHPEEAESLFELEDYYLLYGQIGIVGLDHPEHFGRFINLFNECGMDEIDCALLAIGNYMQREKNGWRYQLGASGRSDMPWRELFHKSASTGFDRTKECLEKLLSRSETFTNDMLVEIKDDYLRGCEENSCFDWRYYYLKYNQFRPGRYGKYWWDDFENAPYCFIALWTQRQASQNAFQPFLKVVDDNDNISRDELGQYLVYEDTYLECYNDAYVVKDLDNNEEVRRLQINQNENGIDTEDRIQKYLNWAEKPN